MLVIIMRGLPGSGKSFLARQLCYKGNTEVGKIYSTDNYWLRPDGFYDFNIRRLSEAHLWNYSRFKEAVYDGFYLFDTLIVDNTNTQIKEFSKYVDLAMNYGHEVRFVEPETEWKYDVDECFKRNSHNVPKDVIQRMLERFVPNEEVIKWYNEKLLYSSQKV